MKGKQKLTSEHLARKAIVYVRQSSPGQVKHNLESQRLQYAMADQARDLGFENVEIIDSDLGSSAALAAKRREGFQKLLGSIALGEVGLVVSREVSRLLRTDKDFCQLLEVCQVFGTRIGDADSIYDLSSMDDQLVLGIKGTLSVVELKVLNMRLQQGKENKAKRGELYTLLPPGYVRDAAEKVVKDPNSRIQQSVQLVFDKFRETGSIRQTFKWFRSNEVELPVGKSRGGKWTIVFQPPRHTFVASVLHNPFYAGVYAWGRRISKVTWDNGELRRRQGSPVPPQEARVFIRNHHEGYIDWATFEENQRMIRNNDMRGGSDDSVGAVRAGKALLAGLIRCGQCGRKLHVRYAGKSGTAARYLCSGSYVADGSRYCIGFGGTMVDRRFSEEILRVLSPLGLRASLEALEQLGSQSNEKRESLERQVEQLEYETARAFEQYNEVDARNRLVAAELERRWNEKLTGLERTRSVFNELDASRVLPSTEDRDLFAALGEYFSDVWDHPACPVELKKKIVRALIKEILVDTEPPGKLTFIIHWQGGSHTSLQMDAPTTSRSKTSEDDVEIIRKMAFRYGDDLIAAVLARMGSRTGLEKPWTQTAVKTARRKYGIKGRATTPPDPSIVSLQEAVRHTGTSDTTIRKLVQAGLLRMHQAVPLAPWEIKRSDLDSEPVRQVIERLKQSGRLELNGGSSDLQGKLFQ